MHSLLRSVLIIFLAVFTAGIVMHTAAAAAMSLEMVLVQDAAMEMDACSGCDAAGMEQGGPICDMDCMLSFAATLPDAAGFSLPQGAELRVFQHVALAGRTGPPGLSPPRTTFLS